MLGQRLEPGAVRAVASTEQSGFGKFATKAGEDANQQVLSFIGQEHADTSEKRGGIGDAPEEACFAPYIVRREAGDFDACVYDGHLFFVYAGSCQTVRAPAGDGKDPCRCLVTRDREGTFANGIADAARDYERDAPMGSS